MSGISPIFAGIRLVSVGFVLFRIAIYNSSQVFQGSHFFSLLSITIEKKEAPTHTNKFISASGQQQSNAFVDTQESLPVDDTPAEPEPQEEFNAQVAVEELPKSNIIPLTDNSGEKNVGSEELFIWIRSLFTSKDRFLGMASSNWRRS